MCVRTHGEYNVLVLDIIVGLSREAANRTYASGSVCYNELSYMTVSLGVYQPGTYSLRQHFDVLIV